MAAHRPTGEIADSMDPILRKQSGAHYTPAELADFVASHVLSLLPSSRVRLLDPAVGDGQLVHSILAKRAKGQSFEVSVFDINEEALGEARRNIAGTLKAPDRFAAEQKDFLADFDLSLSLFFSSAQYDASISNPPYVRTQIMGASAAQDLARRFGLTGRVDLYHAFVLAIAHSLKPGGVLGIIVSNRFLTTRGGESVRTAIAELFDVVHLWDLGDTKLFSAAVLPAVLLLRRKGQNTEKGTPKFTRIYEVRNGDEKASITTSSPITALNLTGLVSANGTTFKVEHGLINWGDSPSNVWRMAHSESDGWLATVAANTASTFSDLGKVRVGVKTTADNVFIKKHWEAPVPELVRPLVTHHVGRNFRGQAPNRSILYTHLVGANGRKQAVDLDLYPLSKAYLESHDQQLRGRLYVVESGRQWFEIWVPQDPSLWSKRKIVFRDIAEHPTFWLDTENIVNGDCYWIGIPDSVPEMKIWLALAVANSKFVAEFYDKKFNNRLYAGRRRFQTQYVAEFPLPDPDKPASLCAAELARQIYDAMATGDAPPQLLAKLDLAVKAAFGV